MRSPSGWHHSGTRGCEPVDTSAASNSTVWMPSTHSTSIVCGPVNRPDPRTIRMPWLSRISVLLSRIRFLMLSMRVVRLSTSTSASLFSNPMPSRRFEKLIAPPVAIIVFDGMQSHRWAAPPTTSRSTMVTSAPIRAACVAALLPAGPPPRMTNRVLTRSGYASN